MTTTVNQKVANPNFPTGGASGTTGTGNLVFSESPTINNPNLTGNVSANVNLRSGTLSTLLPLAGGTSEIGYATDENALVRFNGVAGEAQVYGTYTNGYTKTFTLTNANVADYTTGTSYIDCNHVSYLIIETAPDLTEVITNINIRLPLSTEVNELTVSIPSLINGINFPTSGTFIFTLAYQVGEPGPIYFPIDADEGSLVGASIQINSCLIINVKFIALSGAWSRLPHLPSNETGSILNYTSNLSSCPTSRGYSVKTNNTGLPPSVALTTGVVANTGSITLGQGVWLITGGVEFATSATLVATELSAGIAQFANNSNTSPTNIYNGGIYTQSNLQGGTLYRLSASPVLAEVSAGTETYYQNAKAVFSAGTVSARVFAKAVRIG